MQHGYHNLLVWDDRGRPTSVPWNGDPSMIVPGWEVGGLTGSKKEMKALWMRYGVRERVDDSCQSAGGGGG